MQGAGKNDTKCRFHSQNPHFLLARGTTYVVLLGCKKKGGETDEIKLGNCSPTSDDTDPHNQYYPSLVGERGRLAGLPHPYPRTQPQSTKGRTMTKISIALSIVILLLIAFSIYIGAL